MLSDEQRKELADSAYQAVMESLELGDNWEKAEELTEKLNEVMSGYEMCVGIEAVVRILALMIEAGHENDEKGAAYVTLCAMMFMTRRINEFAAALRAEDVAGDDDSTHH